MAGVLVRMFLHVRIAERLFIGVFGGYLGVRYSDMRPLPFPVQVCLGFFFTLLYLRVCFSVPRCV